MPEEMKVKLQIFVPLSMATEAIKQAQETGRSLSGYVCRVLEGKEKPLFEKNHP